MVKESIKKVFMVSLVSLTAFASAMSLTGCSKGGGKGSGKESTPEYIYESKFNDLGTVGVDYVDQAYINDGNVFMTGSHYDYNEKDGSGTSTSYLMTCDVTGKKVDMIELEGFKKDEYPNKLFMDEGGNMQMLSSVYKYNEKTGESKSKYYLLELGKDGKLSGRTEIKPEIKENEEFYLGSTSLYLDEKLIVASDQKIYTFNKDGSMAKCIEAESYIDTMFATSDGKIYIMAYMEEAAGMGVCDIDIDTGKCGKPIDFGDHSIYNVRKVKQGEGNVVYLSNEDGVYKCDLDKNKLELVFNWINVDIDGNSISDFQIKDDGNIIVLCASSNYAETANDDTTSSIEIANIDKKKYSEATPKKRLTFATSYISTEIKEEILKYNKSSEDYHIDIKSYNEYDNPQHQMNLDIISGSVPDIMEVSYVSKSMYIKKGLLTDLYSLMEKDDEVKKDDFVDSVRNTVEHDGKLYYMPTSFAVVAYTGSKKVFGDMEGWTYEEMTEKYNNMPKDGKFILGMTSDWFIQNMLSSQMEDFINFETGEVNLDSEEFIKMLEFSKNFQTSEEYIKEQEENGWENQDTYELIKKGKLLLNNIYLYDFSDIQVNEKMYKSQGGYNIISEPSKDKNNKLTMTYGDACVAISEKCDDKEGAWKFLRRLFTYEYQKSSTKYNGFPVRKDALEKKIEYAMATKEYTDDDGTKVKPIEGDSYSMDTLTVEIKPYTKAHMDLFRSVIDRIGKENNYDEAFNDITEIITEETKAFYAGDKTAKETAEVLQSRIKIYVSENS